MVSFKRNPKDWRALWFHDFEVTAEEPLAVVRVDLTAAQRATIESQR
jgi:hypothetical protein